MFLKTSVYAGLILQTPFVENRKACNSELQAFLF